MGAMVFTHPPTPFQLEGNNATGGHVSLDPLLSLQPVFEEGAALPLDAPHDLIEATEMIQGVQGRPQGSKD